MLLNDERRITAWTILLLFRKGLLNEDYCVLDGGSAIEFSFVPVRMFAVYQIPPLDTKPRWNTSLDGLYSAGCAC